MRHTLAAAAIVLAGLTQTAAASTFEPFTQAGFDSARNAGQPVLVEVYAPWCPICARQQPTLKALEAGSNYASVHVFRVDYDNQKTVLRALGVHMQSTLIAYHGTTETGRLVGVTNRADIEKLMASALKA